MSAPVRIDALPAVVASRAHVVPGMAAGLAGRLTVGDLLALAEPADVLGLVDALGARLLKSQNLADLADKPAALGNLGVSTFAKTLLDDADASAALSTLGVSTFIKTLLDDADAPSARATLGASRVKLHHMVNRAYGNTGSALPVDDTIPQIAETTGLGTLTITPVSTASVFLLIGIVPAYLNTAGLAGLGWWINSGGNAIDFQRTALTAAGSFTLVAMSVYAPASITPFDLKLQAGGTVTVYINGSHMARLFGGVSGVWNIALEIVP